MATKSTFGQRIHGLKPGGFLRITKIEPSGSLEARRLSSGAVMLYWRYTFNEKTERVSIGVYDSAAPPKALSPTPKGYSLSAAEHAATLLSVKHNANKSDGGYPALIAADSDAKAAAKASALAAETAKKAAAEFTLINLLTEYCDHLEALGRRSHKDARTIFKLHVNEADPAVANLPANAVTSEQIADMMRKLVEAGKGRTANKLRSYLRAAFQTARAAKSKASIPVRFKQYNVLHNPAADTEPDESQNKADKKPLSADELRNYWQIIKPIKGFTGAVLRLHLLTGGQRIEQLVNLLTADVSDNAIVLMDGKGRPGKGARKHMVPLIPAAITAMSECKPVGEFALSTDGGVTHLAATTLSGWAKDAVGTEIAEFSAKRIRSGVETLLAVKKVSRDTRGRLQSHGISGVQARHYDGHDYMDEKREALALLYDHLTRKSGARVVPIRAS